MYLKDATTVSRVSIERVLGSPTIQKRRFAFLVRAFSFRGQIDAAVCLNHRRLKRFAICVESRLTSNSSCSKYLNDVNVSAGVII